jgi:hypothetical protein
MHGQEGFQGEIDHLSGPAGWAPSAGASGIERGTRQRFFRGDTGVTGEQTPAEAAGWRLPAPQPWHALLRIWRLLDRSSISWMCARSSAG